MLTDLSGTYRDSAWPASVACTRQAADEAMASMPGLKVEILQVDHQQKPDLAVSIARAWFDRDGVDAITNCGVTAATSGGTKCLLIAADYAFGHAMQSDLTRWIQQPGGIVAGTVFYPFPATTDVSSYLLQAQASDAKLIGLLNSGGDFINGVKQVSEFGLRPLRSALPGRPLTSPISTRSTGRPLKDCAIPSASTGT